MEIQNFITYFKFFFVTRYILCNYSFKLYTNIYTIETPLKSSKYWTCERVWLYMGCIMCTVFSWFNVKSIHLKQDLMEPDDY